MIISPELSRFRYLVAMSRRPAAWIATIVLCLISWMCYFAGAGQAPPSSPPQTARLRRPIAAAYLHDGTTLCVANQRSGTVSLVDVPRGRVVNETAIGKHLNDLAVLPDGKTVLVVDDERHELIALNIENQSVRVRSRLKTAAYPVSVAASPGGRWASVASLWSRRVQIVDLTPLFSGDKSATVRVRHTVHLPFAPRCQCVLPGGSHLAVADAFGGSLAVLDAAGGKILARHEINGHNLSGLTIAADKKHLLASHQILDQQMPTLEEKVWRGQLMINVVRSLPLELLTKPIKDLDKSSETISLKGNGRGAGDPAGIAVLTPNLFAVALAGVNEVAFVDEEGDINRRVSVERRPTAIVPGKSGHPLAVLNTFDDSLSLVDVRQGLVVGTIHLGSQPALSSADRGELLFFDAHLSRDGWFSCHSCHTDGHTNGLLADTMGDNSFGTPKRTLTLRGTALTDPWAWNGGMKYLQDQIEKSLQDTMHAPTVSGEQINDLLSYLHTLPPPPPLEPATADPTDRETIKRGEALFHERGCIRCHIPPLTYSSHEAHDVGFADENGLRKFNPPSLRGVGQGYRFLHDNRAATLEEVFTKFRHKVGPGLTEEERNDLLRFLRSL
jgi:DNA-binding beta-propeller fold protein YncE